MAQLRSSHKADDGLGKLAGLSWPDHFVLRLKKATKRTFQVPGATVLYDFVAAVLQSNKVLRNLSDVVHNSTTVDSDLDGTLDCGFCHHCSRCSCAVDAGCDWWTRRLGRSRAMKHV